MTATCAASTILFLTLIGLSYLQLSFVLPFHVSMRQSTVNELSLDRFLWGAIAPITPSAMNRITPYLSTFIIVVVSSVLAQYQQTGASPRFDLADYHETKMRGAHRIIVLIPACWEDCRVATVTVAYDKVVHV